MDFRDRDFAGEEVSLDGNTFTGCTFQRCRVVFRGMAAPTLSANSFKEDIQWVFEGPASLTVQFLTALYHGMGEGGKDLVEKTFENIRRGGR